MRGSTLATAVTRNDGAVYLQAVTAPARTATLTVGARLEDNERFGSYATYRTGVSVRLAAGGPGGASIRTGFKEPRLSENFANGVPRGDTGRPRAPSFDWEG